MDCTAALLINHHQLLPLRVHAEAAWKVLLLCVPVALPGPIISPLSYTNMLIIRVWEKTDERTCKVMRVKRGFWSPSWDILE